MYDYMFLLLYEKLPSMLTFKKVPVPDLINSIC